jgi:AcrR family transcriptional regulator
MDVRTERAPGEVQGAGGVQGARETSEAGEAAGVGGAAGRILDAALTCVARYGVAKTTLEDVAREAGCARATVYRYFGGKRRLLEAAVGREGARLVAAVDAAAAGAPTLEDALVSMGTTAGRALADSAPLRFVLTHEPEAILPALTFEGGDRFLADTATALAPIFGRLVAPADAPRVAEWCARVFLAHCGEPDARVSMTDPDHVRELVRAFVVPALAPVAPQTTSSQTRRG